MADDPRSPDGRTPSSPSATGASRRRYHTPRLESYGQLRDLTSGGSGAMQEGFLMVLMTRFP